MKRIDVNELKQKCPLPHLLHRLGLGRYARSSCQSPFRNDGKASWGIFQYGGRWMYKDFGTAEVGDEIGLLAKLRGLDPHDDFLAVLNIYQDVVNGRNPTSAFSLGAKSGEKIRPDVEGFGPGSQRQIQRLSD